MAEVVKAIVIHWADGVEEYRDYEDPEDYYNDREALDDCEDVTWIEENVRPRR